MGISRTETTPFQTCTDSSSSSSDAANPPTKKGKKLKCRHPSPTKTQRSIPIFVAPGYRGGLKNKSLE